MQVWVSVRGWHQERPLDDHWNNCSLAPGVSCGYGSLRKVTHQQKTTVLGWTWQRSSPTGFMKNWREHSGVSEISPMRKTIDKRVMEIRGALGVPLCLVLKTPVWKSWRLRPFVDKSPGHSTEQELSQPNGCLKKQAWRMRNGWGKSYRNYASLPVVEMATVALMLCFFPATSCIHIFQNPFSQPKVCYQQSNLKRNSV